VLVGVGVGQSPKLSVIDVAMLVPTIVQPVLGIPVVKFFGVPPYGHPIIPQ
jgi:hypothetical protein